MENNDSLIATKMKPSKIIEADFILKRIPHTPPFRFIDELVYVDSETSEGHYTFDEQLNFYNGHFPNYKITPGVILIETMAQIGLLPLGIYNYLVEVNSDGNGNAALPLLTGSSINFKNWVLPGEKVYVTGKKKFFRHGKLVCEVNMRNSMNAVVCFGTLEGIIFNNF